MELSPESILFGYSIGIFPMADPDDKEAIGWYDPPMRGIIPLDGLKISKSLRSTIRSNKFHVTINTDFENVMRGCAKRSDTWISEDIIESYCRLNEMGFGFSFETRNKQNKLVGGLYGIAMGKAFFGESMFHLEPDASKVALISLVDWLKSNHFTLLDTQYLTDHLLSLGGIEISREEYKRLLREALE